MNEAQNTGETEIPALDISEKVMSILDDPNDRARSITLHTYLRELRNEPALSLTMDWRSADAAKWAKAFLEDFDALSRKQKRTAAIRCTEQQMLEAANVFSSGVEWINSEPPSS